MNRSASAVSITSARVSHTEELRLRQRRYVVTMAIRTVCFVGAVIVAHWSPWLSLALIVASMVLPLMGVTSANAPMVIKQEEPELMSLTAAPASARLLLEPGRVIDAE